ncbi:MAG: dTDP-4-dehydrorhamnose reductase [Rhodospirillaceae bacterium]|nr:dTDP-4-dehydrorhamnose reductase [Rhodospirillaceae bacterium]MBT5457027.1 dTDP-4-dehydrorhamnose reductase [Rhodospirillaceae bacterium]
MEKITGSGPILLFGGTGQVGSELSRTLPSLGPVVTPRRPDIDLADPDSMIRCIRASEPSLIINAAAYTAVDAAEQDTGTAEAVNATAPGIMAEEARRRNIPLIHYSTDYVFDGNPAETRPYCETDRPAPLNVYGQSKLNGERAIGAAAPAHLILRTSWVYSNHGNNIFLTVKRLAAERRELRMVDDQVGSPTFARSIAEATTAILRNSYSERPSSRCPSLSEASGRYHLSADGQTTWCGFAQAIVKAIVGGTINGDGPVAPKVTGIPTSDYPLPAKRPAYSVLDNSLLRETFGVALPSWQHQLRQCLEG